MRISAAVLPDADGRCRVAAVSCCTAVALLCCSSAAWSWGGLLFCCAGVVPAQGVADAPRRSLAGG